MSQSQPGALSRPGLPRLIAATAIHAVLWLILLLYLGLYVPRLARTYRDFNLQLPEVSELTLALSSWTVSYFYLLPVPFLLLVGLDGWVFTLLRRATGGAWPGYVWSALVSLGSLLVLALVVAASYGPWVKLQEALSR